jgi:hypothetical protein
MEKTGTRSRRATLGGRLVVAAACAAAALFLLAPVAGARCDYHLVYFDGHMHTVESDGSGTVEDIKTAAVERGIDAVIVTNHAEQLTVAEWDDLNRRARRLSGGGFLMINAFEITGSEGLLNRDHVLAWGVDDPFVGGDADELTPREVWDSPTNPAGTGAMDPDSIAKWVRYVHRQGGIAVHAHTTGTTSPAYGVDYIELFNLSHVKDVAYYARMMGVSPAQAWSLGLTLNTMAVYGDRDLGMMVQLPISPDPLPLGTALYAATRQLTGVGVVLGGPAAPLHSWDDLLMGYVRGEIDHPTFGVADSDAHNTYNVTGHTFKPGSGDVHGDYAFDDSDVGEARNGVLVHRLTSRDLLDAIRAGRCFATTGPELRFTVDGRDMGETVRVDRCSSHKARLRFAAEAGSVGSVIAQVTVVKNGKALQEYAPMSPSFSLDLRDAIAEDGYYRVEVVGVDTQTGQYQFAYTNPVFVDLRGR